MTLDRRVDVEACEVWSAAGGQVHIGYGESSMLMPNDEVLDMLKALSTWYLMGRTEEVVIRDE